MVDIELLGGDDEVPDEVEAEVMQGFQNQGSIRVQEPSDLAESMKAINDDSLDEGSNMSKIDMKTRLHRTEIAGILSVDTLVSLKVLPQRCLNFTRQKKRLAVSEDGKGRAELVEIVRGKQDQEAKVGQSAFSGLKNMFVKQ